MFEKNNEMMMRINNGIYNGMRYNVYKKYKWYNKMNKNIYMGINFMFRILS
jgi:hypothetical protein